MSISLGHMWLTDDVMFGDRQILILFLPFKFCSLREVNNFISIISNGITWIQKLFLILQIRNKKCLWLNILNLIPDVGYSKGKKSMMISWLNCLLSSILTYILDQKTCLYDIPYWEKNQPTKQQNLTVVLQILPHKKSIISFIFFSKI